MRSTEAETIPIPVEKLPTTSCGGAIARRTPALMPTSFDETEKLAKSLAPSALLPPQLRGKEAEIFMTLLAGQELGLSPMASLRAFHVIEGIPRLAASTMVAICQASPLCEYFVPVEQTATTSTWETKRRNQEPRRYTYTMAQQKVIGWRDGSGWSKYPDRMLSARAASFLARDVYADLMSGFSAVEDTDDATGMSSEQKAGAFEAMASVVMSSAASAPAAAPTLSLTEDEEATLGIILEALKDADRAGLLTMRDSLARETPAVIEAAEPHLYRALIAAASSVAELKQLAGALKDRPGVKELLRDAYKARLDELNPRVGGGGAT